VLIARWASREPGLTVPGRSSACCRFSTRREDSADTIAGAERMGLEVRMITGDHVAIAREISKTLGLGANVVSAHEVFSHDGRDGDGARIEAADGFAEAFPEHKFRIVRILQRAGHIVGMTGDGVNDVPARMLRGGPSWHAGHLARVHGALH
jgi:hypothetical protein